MKESEHRVAATPAVVEELVRHGHEVLIEAGAGLGSGIADEEYAAVGGRIVGSPADVYASAELVVKVKEPVPHEIEMLREGQVLFAYLHCPDPATQGLLDKGRRRHRHETVQLDRTAAALMPMSEVAGRISFKSARPS